MLYGLQVYFDAGQPPSWILDGLRQRRVSHVRLDAQALNQDQALANFEHAIRHGLIPVPIIGLDRPDTMLWFPDTTLAGARTIVLLGNEHDPGGIGTPFHPTIYRPKLDLACQIKREQKPGIILGGPELSNLDGDSQAWAGQVRGAAWPDGLDWFTFHRYGRNASWDTPHRGFSSRDAEIEWITAMAAGLPLAMTEGGWGSRRGMTEDLQADYTKREWVFYDGHGIVLAMDYQLRDGAGDGEDFGWLRYPDETWKPKADSVPLTAPVPPDPSEPPPTDPGEPEPEPDDPLKGLMKIALKADNGRFVTAENGGDDEGILRANRESPEPYAWEIFGVVFLPGGQIALKTSSGRFWCAEQGGGQALVANRTKQAIWEQFTPSAPLTHGAKIGLRCYDGIHYVSCEVLNADPILVANRPWLQAWETFEVVVVDAAIPDYPQRTGIVVGAGRALQDQQGQYRPLVVTFFWGMFGWKFERPRIQQHLRWLQTQPVDALRILGEVDWPGRSISPDWDDYHQVGTELLDACYAHGKRLKVTLIGGKDGRGLGMKVADKWRQIAQGRHHQILEFEMVNEWWNKIDLATLERMGSFMRMNTPNLVALSTPAPTDEDDPQGPERLKLMIEAAGRVGCQCFVLHTRRKNHDSGWAQVRQSYDFEAIKGIDRFIGDHGEPPGLASSVKVCEDPLLLAQMRGLGLMCGCPNYCLHVGQGVTGVADPTHGRPNNMWEVPNIEPIISTLRQVEQLIPAWAENGRIVNNGGNNSPHPLRLDPVTGFWQDSENNGRGNVNKNYCVIHPDGRSFVVSLQGVQSEHADEQPTWVGTPRETVRLRAFDTESRKQVDEKIVQPGVKFLLPGRRDRRRGYFVHGEFV